MPNVGWYSLEFLGVLDTRRIFTHTPPFFSHGPSLRAHERDWGEGKGTEKCIL